MGTSLTRVNFWGPALPYEVHRNAQRVLVRNGLLDPSKVTASHGNTPASCMGEGNSYSCHVED